MKTRRCCVDCRSEYLSGMKPTLHSFSCGQPLGPGVAHHGMRNLIHYTYYVSAWRAAPSPGGWPCKWRCWCCANGYEHTWLLCAGSYLAFRCFSGYVRRNSEVSPKNGKLEVCCFALLVMLLMCWFHCKSDVIVTPKYLAESVSDKLWLWDWDSEKEREGAWRWGNRWANGSRFCRKCSIVMTLHWKED